MNWAEWCAKLITHLNKEKKNYSKQLEELKENCKLCGTQRFCYPEHCTIHKQIEFLSKNIERKNKK